MGRRRKIRDVQLAKERRSEVTNAIEYAATELPQRIQFESRRKPANLLALPLHLTGARNQPDETRKIFWFEWPHVRVFWSFQQVQIPYTLGARRRRGGERNSGNLLKEESFVICLVAIFTWLSR